MKAATVVAVQSGSNPRLQYRVWVGPQGPIFCECPGHKYARHGVRKPCKHMRDLVDAPAVDRAARALAEIDSPNTAAVINEARAPLAWVTPERAGRFSFLELQHEVSPDVWTTSVDLRRFNNLEV